MIPFDTMVPDWYAYIPFTITPAAAAIAVLFGWFWYNDGKLGHTYGHVNRKKMQGILSIGDDMRARLKPVVGDGITLEYGGGGSSDPAKSYSPKKDTRFSTVDGIALYLNYAPSYATISPRMIATITWLKEKKPEILDLIEKKLDQHRTPRKTGFKEMEGPDLDEKGQPKIDGEGKPLLKFYRIPFTEVEEKLADLSADPVDKKEGGVSTQEIFDAIVKGAKEHVGFLLSPQIVYDHLAAVNPYDLHVVKVKGESLGIDKERRRQGSEMIKYLAIGIMVLFSCLGLAFLWTVVGK